MLKLHAAVPWLVVLQSLAGVAHALPVIDKTQAAGPARQDPGGGLCASSTHFTGLPSPPSQRADAAAVCDKPSNDPNVLGRVISPWTTINLRNGLAGAAGDFTAPNFPDASFPYSSAAAATPTGDDRNLAVRLRGYFNVPAALAGKVISFAVNCDDFCSLRIGKTDLILAADVRTSPRVIRQVNFADAGLYPVEIIYYQNATAGYLEWALAESAVPECPSDQCLTALTDAATYAGKFNIVTAKNLYSAIQGASTACQECGAAGMVCAAGNYCGDGLCQSCNTSQHCGAACSLCPTSAPYCNAGQCVQCQADDQCPSGQTCDIARGKCMLPRSCTRTDECLVGQTCDFCSNLCSSEDLPCTLDTMCPSGQKCMVDGRCQPPCSLAPTNKCCWIEPCNVDSDCKTGFRCDLSNHQCVDGTSLTGGSAGCTVPGRTRSQSAGMGLAMAALLLAGCGLLSWRARRRRQPPQ